jgi:hypothetical protein
MSFQITQLPSPGRTDSQCAGARKQIAMLLLTLQTYRFHSIQTCRSRVMEFLGLVVLAHLYAADFPPFEWE